MLKLKLQYFGHLMRKTDSLEKTLTLGKIKGRRRRGRQKEMYNKVHYTWSSGECIILKIYTPQKSSFFPSIWVVPKEKVKSWASPDSSISRMDTGKCILICERWPHWCSRPVSKCLRKISMAHFTVRSNILHWSFSHKDADLLPIPTSYNVTITSLVRVNTSNSQILFPVSFYLPCHKNLITFSFKILFSHYVVSDSLPTLWIATHQAALSFTISWSLLIFMSIVLVMLSNHLILCCSFLLLSSIFPSIIKVSGEGKL